MRRFAVRAVVSLRRSILDVQGKTVEQALQAIGFPMIAQVRIGKYIEMEVEASSAEEARAVGEEACRRLLANPVIEDYRIVEVEPVPAVAVGEPQ
ncbi:Phosphoribosylformylglycinamidine synthase subunit PurS [bacterium HR21]|jgi:phosphoribosylformylglycinamidine synthase|nr:Phosphoribosylformylglycinamidine synthase subunit PurS [bacterium HR21]